MNGFLQLTENVTPLPCAQRDRSNPLYTIPGLEDTGSRFSIHYVNTRVSYELNAKVYAVTFAADRRAPLYLRRKGTRAALFRDVKEILTLAQAGQLTVD